MQPVRERTFLRFLDRMNGMNRILFGGVAIVRGILFNHGIRGIRGRAGEGDMAVCSLVTKKNEEIRYLRRKCRIWPAGRSEVMKRAWWLELIIAGTCVDFGGTA